jgi:broad specificity phosphatase PhoE
VTWALAVDLVAGDQFLYGDNGAHDVVVTVVEPLRELGRKDSIGRTYPSISARREDTGAGWRNDVRLWRGSRESFTRNSLTSLD